jgi:hypothetical protein
MLLARSNIFMEYFVYLVFDLQWAPDLEKIEISSLAPEHVINPGELRFSIGLPANWQSSIGPLCSNQAERLHLRHNSCFIFGIIAASSSCSASFFTDVMWLMMCSI